VAKIYRVTGIQLFKNKVELTDATGKRFQWTLPETSNVKRFRVGTRLALKNGMAVII
jgi:hypothetical protein